MSIARKLLHTRYRVNDLERTVKFYRDVLGLQVRYRHDGREWWDTLLALSPGGFRLVRIEQRWDQANGGSSPRRV